MKSYTAGRIQLGTVERTSRLLISSEMCFLLPYYGAETAKQHIDDQRTTDPGAEPLTPSDENVFEKLERSRFKIVRYSMGADPWVHDLLAANCTDRNGNTIRHRFFPRG